MNCASVDDAGLAQQADGALVLLDRGFLVEEIELQLRGGLGAERDVDEARLAVEGQKLLVAQNVGDAGVDAPQTMSDRGRSAPGRTG
jgi:hypothetical protein